MVNRRTLELVYRECYPDELAHHGVEGQSWGDRNGPPYPLANINKKMARAEYKLKKAKERELKKLEKAKAKRLKKLQKAAKKARATKKKQEAEQAARLKKKQMLVKEGNLDKIRKNAELFTNEELEYILERDAQKRALGSQEQRDKEEKLNNVMARIAQVADIAVSAGKVFQGIESGAKMVAAFKDAKLKDANIEEKRMSTIKSEFEMRFKGREDSREAQEFIDATVGNPNYTSPAESKAEKAKRKAAEDLDVRQTKSDKKLLKEQQRVEYREARAELDSRNRAVDQYWKDQKDAKKADRQKGKDDQKAGNSTNKKDSSWNLFGRNKNKDSGNANSDFYEKANAGKQYYPGSDPRDWSTSFSKQQRPGGSPESSSARQRAANMLLSDLSSDKNRGSWQLNSVTSGGSWAKGLLNTAKPNAAATRPVKTLSSGGYTSAGSSWVNSFLSGGNFSGRTYSTSIPQRVTPVRAGSPAAARATQVSSSPSTRSGSSMANDLFKALGSGGSSPIKDYTSTFDGKSRPYGTKPSGLEWLQARAQGNFARDTGQANDINRLLGFKVRPEKFKGKH